MLVVVSIRSNHHHVRLAPPSPRTCCQRIAVKCSGSGPTSMPWASYSPAGHRPSCGRDQSRREVSGRTSGRLVTAGSRSWQRCTTGPYAGSHMPSRAWTAGSCDDHRAYTPCIHTKIMSRVAGFLLKKGRIRTGCRQYLLLQQSLKQRKLRPPRFLPSRPLSAANFSRRLRFV